MDTEAMNQMIEQCSAMMRSMQQMMDGMGGMSAMSGAAGSGGGDMAGMLGGVAPWSWPMVAIIAAGAVLIGAVALGAVRHRRQRASAGAASAKPAVELERRYASGELTRDLYLQIRDDLRIAPS